MSKALELAKFGRETPPTGVVVGDTDAQTLSSKTFSDMPVFSSGTANTVAYLNASKVLSSSTSLSFDGSNLGIGVPSPAATLDVYGGASGRLQIYSSASGNFLTSKVAANTGYQILNYLGSQHVWGDGTNTKMVIDASGNVGINTPTPALKLDVNGSIKMSGGTGTALTWDTAIGSQYLKYDSTLDGLILAGYGGLGFRVAGSATNAITVSSTGNLGIGAAPTAVTGFGINKFLEIGGASVPGLVFRPTGSTSEHSVLGAGDGLLIGAAGAATAAGNNVIRFFTSNTNSSTSVTERLRIASNGTIVKYGANGALQLMDGNTAGGVKIGAYAANLTTDGYLAFEGYSIEYGRFDSSGNFMVGVTSTSAIANRNIDVNGTGDASFNVRVGGSTVAYLYSTAGQTILGTNINIPLTFYPNNVKRMSIGTDGTVTIGNAVAATNVNLHLNGVANKAKRLVFQDSGVEQWLIGSGAASENDAFELYNANGQMALTFAKATSNAAFVGNVKVGSNTSSGQTLVVNGNGDSGDGASIAIQVVGSTKYQIGRAAGIVSGTSAAFGYWAASGLGHEWYANGGATANMTLSAAGNVGIGTTPTTSARLQVEGYTDFWNSTNTLLRVMHDGTRSRLQSYTGGGAGNIVLNPDGGNVGVGISNPLTALQVSGTVRASTGYMIGADKYIWQGNQYTGGLTANDIIIAAASTGSTVIWAADIGNVFNVKASGELVINQQAANYNFRVRSTGDANMLFVNASTNRVGIGTSDPQDMLDVAGNARIGQNQIVSNATVGSLSIHSGMTFNTGNAQLKLFGRSVDNTGLTYELGRISSGSFGSPYTIGGGLAFFTAENNGANVMTLYERMRITAGGAVGIGLGGGDPAASLHVQMSRTSSTSGIALILADNVTGGQTNNVYKAIRSASNNGASQSEIRFVETDGTNNNTAIAFATAHTAGGLSEKARVTPDGQLMVGTMVGNAGSGGIHATGSILQGGAGLYQQQLSITGGNAIQSYVLGVGYTDLRLNPLGGNVQINTTSTVDGNGAALVINCAYPKTRMEIRNDGEANGLYAITFRNVNGLVGNITTQGSSTAFNTSSDYRLKNTITPMTNALAKVALLKPVTYKWNADGSNGEGFIAHELAEVCPQAVFGEKDALEANGSIKPQGIDTSFLVATLTAAIQEQQVIIQSLKARLDAANL